MYIVVPSYPSIYYAIYQYQLNNDVVVITNNKSVKKIVKQLGIKYVFLDFQVSLKNLLKSKLKLTKLLNCLDLDKDFYLLDNVHCIEGFYLAKKWTMGKVFYQNLSTEYPLFIDSVNIKPKINQYLLRLFLGLNLVFRKQNTTPVLGIDNHFLNEYEINHLNIGDYEHIKLEVLKKVQLKTKKYDTIIVLQGDLKGIIRDSSLFELYNEFSKIKSIVIKEHPKHKIKKSDFDLPRLPDFYPVEMCYTNIKQNVVAVFSLSLIIASKMDDKKAISLLEIVEWDNKEYKKQMKELLISKSSNKIIFPKTIEELRNELKIERIS